MQPRLSPASLTGRVVVVSPHLDDGVLSLGAVMSAASRGGADVELLTVFGCDPDSETPTGGWDSRAGHRTEGESARARREEDRRACAILGVTPVWLPFGSVDYERHGDESDVRAALEAATVGAGVVLFPGYPLTHPDHEWLARRILGDSLAGRRLGRYAEQPYTRREGRVASSFRSVDVGARDRIRKWRAIREYRSQLPLLGMRRSLRSGPLSLAWAPELVAWPEDRDRAHL